MQSILNRVLAVIAFLLAAAIVIGTLVSFALKKAHPGKNIRTPDPSPLAVSSMNAPDNTKLDAFTGLGRLRAATKPDPKKSTGGTPVVVTPWFSYPAGDRAFYEELSQKSTIMRAVITEYFLKYTEDELLSRGEEKIKADLLTALNERLSLNKIQAIYFSDYLFIE
ncbi:hypothetical protein HMPREF1221_02313 [Treponema socranskii subsp. paredis ATCC 35535]|nr:hypothetical protein HMPREF1221_02313 [Treponema socranskii subsp. paredis ATCC 35535]